MSATAVGPATLLLTAALLVPAGCERVGPAPASMVELTLASIQSRIFADQCALSGCHQGSVAPLGLDLTPGRAAATLIGVPSAQVAGLARVQPGNPDDSYLLIKLRGDSRMAVGTARMPSGRPPLPAEQLETIRRWIEAGAPATDAGDAGSTAAASVSRGPL